jgi:hypothetical protein
MTYVTRQPLLAIAAATALEAQGYSVTMEAHGALLIITAVQLMRVAA